MKKRRWDEDKDMGSVEDDDDIEYNGDKKDKEV